MEEQWRLAEEEQKNNVPDFILPQSQEGTAVVQVSAIDEDLDMFGSST